MQAKQYDKERVESIAICRKFHKICIEEKLYLKANISRTEYARLLNTNHVYLCRRIKMGSGLSLKHFIRAIRMSIAYKQLKSTNYNMATILSNCGYKDKSSFYRAFHERFHCSPNELRRRYFSN